MDQKYKNLKKITSNLDDAVIAFSGGVDSSLTLALAKKFIKGKVIAVTSDSPTLPRSELERAKKIAKKLGVEHIIINTKEMENKNFIKNPPQRCYFCKSELFKKTKEISRKKGMKNILCGENKEDYSDFRPGHQAAKEMNVLSPLAEAGFTKEEVRRLAKKLNLPNWNKPATACLASRIPYGETITETNLDKIEKAESYLQKLGFNQVRVRLHQNNLARIEILPNQFKKFLENNLNLKIARKLKEFGFTYITHDLMGYRRGSMNESIKKRLRKKT